MPEDALKPKLALRGATNGTTLRATPNEFCPFQAIRNIRVAYSNGRPVVVRRGGFKRLLSTPLRDGPVQAVVGVSRAQDTALTMGACSTLGPGLSSPSGALTGQVSALDDVPSQDWISNIDVTGSGGPSTNGANACAWHPDGTFLAVATNYVVGGFARFTVVAMNPATGGILWQTESSEAGKNRSVNTIFVTALYTFVAIANNSTAGGAAKVIAYRNDTGAQAWTSNLEGWANEAVCLAGYVSTVTGNQYLFVAFHGSATVGSYHGGVGSGIIQAGRWAFHFRSGIMKFLVDSTAYGGSVAVRQTYGPQKGPTDAYFENTGGRTAPIGYWRLSEQNNYPPHGGEFTGLQAMDDGTLYYAKRNQGWGPNPNHALFLPDGNTEPYRTIGKINPDGTRAWIGGSQGILEAQDPVYTTFYNDLTFPGDPDPGPSINAITLDLDGNVFAGGRQNPAGVSVFANDSDGVDLWAANIMSASGSVAEAGACTDSDHNPVFVGTRNDAWDNADGKKLLWKLSRTTGEIIETFDFAETVNGLAVASAGDGRLFVCTDKIT